jgi:hydrogenase expression/formation protein HypD
MTIKYIEEFRDTILSQDLIGRIKKKCSREMRLMEVCGTHTMSMFRHGIRSLLPANISLISGPGCPVCVTDQNEIDAFIELAKCDDVIIATFGDLLRVPGADSSLQEEQANGRDVRIVYSTVDALEIAKQNPEKKIVFLGVGFETTAPTVAASILAAKQAGLKNYFVFSAHKTMPAALDVLMNIKGVRIDGFLLPGHVSVIIGVDAYRSFQQKFNIPCAIAGFEPTDILQAILMLVRQIESEKSKLANAYKRVVTNEGNIRAREVMYQVFEPGDALWRGIGKIAESGLKIRNGFESYDALKTFNLTIGDLKNDRGCICGKILTGLATPEQCPLYKTKCTPTDPVGPCMVSSEGTCAAYYKYQGS